MKRIKTIWLILLFMFIAEQARSQYTVFGLFKRDVQLGDDYFQRKDYYGALTLYQNEARKSGADEEINLRIARCYYILKEYKNAIRHFELYLKKGSSLSQRDLYYYAESQAAIANYERAVASYQQYLLVNPNDELVTQKIWRLNHIQYLLEDSTHFAVRPISVNTDFGELCGVLYHNNLVFMSNRPEQQLVNKVNASLNAPFYRIYSAKVNRDTDGSGTISYGKIFSFGKEIDSRYNVGPLSFYNNDQKMAFVTTSTQVSSQGVRTLQLYFAENKDGTWRVTNSFPYNSIEYSISDLAINEDGSILYFSSDMPGGMGGKDIYISTFEHGNWTKPVNLGEPVNTPQDEAFPYLHQNRTLYFSSNGHPGLGGLDIFQSALKTDGYSEPQNVGYPINSSYDDFGIIVDSLDTHGYFSSNRKGGGYNDDIYEFDMDLQTYPVTIKGVLRYREHILNDTSGLKIMGMAKLYLKDNLRNTVVAESTSDEAGNFTLVVPYFSKFAVRVVGIDGADSHVVLEIPKHRKQLGNHEIVVIKDIF